MFCLPNILSLIVFARLNKINVSKIDETFILKGIVSCGPGVVEEIGILVSLVLSSVQFIKSGPLLVSCN